MPRLNNLVIVGLGLMGGSLGLAARKKGVAKKVIGVARQEATLKEALRLKAIDEGTLDLDAASSKADLLILATPVSSILSLARQIQKKVSSQCVISDVGSTKEKIVSTGESFFGGQFVGAHPMAGSEKSGIKNADVNLYNNSICILTPTKYTNIKTLNEISFFWSALGAKIKQLDPQTHDCVVANVSHFPHLLAYLLTYSLSKGRKNIQELLGFSGAGFRDMTRIAKSSPQMWSDIFFENKKELLKQINSFKDELLNFKKLLSSTKKKQVKELLLKAKKIRDKLE